MSEQLEYFTVPPSGQPILRIPLQDVVEVGVEAGDEFFEQTPEGRVDAFLDANSTIFAAVDDAWGGVKAAQRHAANVVEAMTEGSVIRTGASRATRRVADKVTRHVQDSNFLVGTSKLQATEQLPVLFAAVDLENAPDVAHSVCVAALEKLWRSGEEEVAARREQVAHLDIEAAEGSGSLIRADAITQISYYYAMFRQEVALRKIRAFLQDDSVGPAFVDRVVSLAQSDDMEEYPGLLELLATHVEQAGADNMLQDVLRRTAPSTSAYAEALLETVSTDEERTPKELAVAMKFIELAARVVETETSLDRSHLLRSIAGFSDEWPPAAAAKLHDFVKSQNAVRWRGVKDALTPFVRVGRMPSKPSAVAVRLPHQLLGQKGPRHPGVRQGPTKRPGQIEFRVATGPLADIGVAERAPIRNFALLSTKGTEGSKLGIQPVDDIAALFAESNFDAYIARHNGDTTLRDVLTAAVAHITANPTDRNYTKHLVSGEYTLEGRNGHRRLLRFSAQRFPGVAKGPVATKTRIIYDLLKVEQTPTLVVYGAFIKRELDSMGLPRPH